MAERDFKGVWIPKEVWLDERLNALEKVILVEIDSLDSSDGHCWKSNENLAAFCQCSVTKVSTAISKLIDLGYVKVHSFDGRTRRLQSCLSVFAGQPFKNCKADFQKVKASNTYSNPFSNSDREEVVVEGACACEWNPFGEDGGEIPDTNTVELYASGNLQYMSPTAMEELVSFRDSLDDEVIRHGIDVACDNGKRVWSYARAILNRYVREGARSIGEALASDERNRKKSGGPSQRRGAIDRDNNRVPERYGGGEIL